MDEHLPTGLSPHGPGTARRRPKRKLKLVTDSQVIEVQDIWSGGFSIARSGPQPRHGFVDLLDDEELLCRGLVYPNGETADQRIYAFKMARAAGLVQPRDYAGGSDPE